MSIYAKLGAIQKKLVAPKGQYNEFGKYNFRSCEDVLKALKPLCEEHGTVLYITNDLEEIGGRNYVKATVRLIEIETGESVESTAHAREEETKKGMDGSQITGASSSYARKYALAGMFCIDNEKDSDATNHGDKPIEGISSQLITSEMAKAVYAECNRTGIGIIKILEEYGLNTVTDMTCDTWRKVMARFKATKSKT